MWVCACARNFLELCVRCGLTKKETDLVELTVFYCTHQKLCISNFHFLANQSSSVSALKCEVCGWCWRGFGGDILNYWIHVQTLWSAEYPCLWIPAQSFYVPVVPSGIIYNSRQFCNSPFGAIYMDHRGCQSQARNTYFSRVALSFPLSFADAMAMTLFFLVFFSQTSVNLSESELKLLVFRPWPRVMSAPC